MGRAGCRAVAARANASEGARACVGVASSCVGRRQRGRDQPADPAAADFGSAAPFSDSCHDGPQDILEFDGRRLGAQGPARAGCRQRRDTGIGREGYRGFPSPAGHDSAILCTDGTTGQARAAPTPVHGYASVSAGSLGWLLAVNPLDGRKITSEDSRAASARRLADRGPAFQRQDLRRSEGAAVRDHPGLPPPSTPRTRILRGIRNGWRGSPYALPKS